MDFKDKYPDFAAIEGHIHTAHAERSVAVSQAIVAAIEVVIRGLKSFARTLGRGYAVERDRRAVEADTFLKRSVPKY
jgi:hypothetical protein